MNNSLCNLIKQKFKSVSSKVLNVSFYGNSVIIKVFMPKYDYELMKSLLKIVVEVDRLASYKYGKELTFTYIPVDNWLK